MTELNHVRIVPDGDRFKIVTAFLGNSVGRLAFAAAGMTGDGIGLTSKEAEVQARKLERWLKAHPGKRHAKK
jgi:hypothetical protein